MSRLRMAVLAAVTVLASLVVPAHEPAHAAAQPNIFFYNLDDLRDQVVGGVDPLTFMPKVRQWMAAGTRFQNSYVTDPSCCPSRSAMMTGRYPHNNGVTRQDQGPSFDLTHTMACYLKSAGYATYVDGKFLTTWPSAKLPPCFDHSTVMWSGYNSVAIRTDGVVGKATGYTTTFLGARGRQYINSALTQSKPFMLYETPQAPHWVPVTNPNGAPSKLAIPED